MNNITEKECCDVPPGNVTDKVKRWLRDYIDKCDYVYVGRTNNPKQRFSEHQRNLEPGVKKWDEMIVVYGSKYLGNSVEMENALIEYIQRNRFDGVRWNSKGTQWRGPQYFSVYLLLDRLGQRKASPNTTPYEAGDLLTGHYGPTIKGTLINRVDNYIKRQQRFYIGLTNDPWRRFGEHQREWLTAWDELLVIYQTSSLDYAAKAEAMLIEHFGNHAKIRNGAKGMVSEAVEPYFYVYFLLDRKRNDRRNGK